MVENFQSTVKTEPHLPRSFLYFLSVDDSESFTYPVHLSPPFLQSLFLVVVVFTPRT